MGDEVEQRRAFIEETPQRAHPGGLTRPETETEHERRTESHAAARPRATSCRWRAAPSTRRTASGASTSKRRCRRLHRLLDGVGLVGRACGRARRPQAGNRRILCAMRERGWTHAKAFVKCAKVVGEVIGILPSHGDRRGLRHAGAHGADSHAIMLVKGQGNFAQHRRRSRGGLPLHRSASWTSCRGSAGGHRQGHRRDAAELRRVLRERVLPARIPTARQR